MTSYTVEALAPPRIALTDLSGAPATSWCPVHFAVTKTPTGYEIAAQGQVQVVALATTIVAGVAVENLRLPLDVGPLDGKCRVPLEMARPIHTGDPCKLHGFILAVTVE